jgi:hypothetical protein
MYTSLGLIEQDKKERWIFNSPIIVLFFHRWEMIDDDDYFDIHINIVLYIVLILKNCIEYSKDLDLLKREFEEKE